MDQIRENKVPQKITSPVLLQHLVNSNGNAKNREIKMQPNFASSKRQKLNAAKIVCLTLYKPITLNSKLCTVLMQISIFRDKPS